MRPTYNRPDSVIPHFEPLSASGAALEMEAGDLVEDKEKEKACSEIKEKHTARGKVRSAPEGPSEQDIST